MALSDDTEGPSCRPAQLKWAGAPSRRDYFLLLQGRSANITAFWGEHARSVSLSDERSGRLRKILEFRSAPGTVCERHPIARLKRFYPDQLSVASASE